MYFKIFLSIVLSLIGLNNATLELGTCNLQCDGADDVGSVRSNPQLSQGPAGKAGPKGDVGSRGAPGAKGDKGLPGNLPETCSDLTPSYGVDASGVYVIYPFGNQTALPVYCDLQTDGGGWMIIQRRMDGSEDFNRNFADYVKGFGKITGELWIGLNVIHELTKDDEYKLRIDMESFENETRYALYSTFIVGEETDYMLTFNGYNGTAGNGLLNTRFSAKDFDQDTYEEGSCAVAYKGGWWYTSCHNGNPNGLYLRGRHESYADGVNWGYWLGFHYSLKRFEMKIKKKN